MNTDLDIYMAALNIPNPDYDIKVDRELSINTVIFGDGYKQDIPIGINHSVEVIETTWSILDQSTSEDLMQFFIDRGGYKPFYWTPATKGQGGTIVAETDLSLNPDGTRTAVKKQWKALDYSSVKASFGRYRISAKFIQDFTPGVITE